jgi:phosphoglycolate phosphatase-like HAD superfamily hydrolase
MIKYLIWDLDGTLFDTYPAFTSAFIAAIHEFGHTANPGRVFRLARSGLSECASVLASDFGLTQGEVIETFTRHYSQIPLEDQLPFPGAREVCKDVVRIGGINVLVTHRGAKTTIGLLNTHELAVFFSDWITADDGFPRKPDPSGVESIIERNGIIKEEALLIGDRRLDIETGNASKVRTCLFGSGEKCLNADHNVTDFNELKGIISSENEPVVE